MKTDLNRRQPQWKTTPMEDIKEVTPDEWKSVGSIWWQIPFYHIWQTAYFNLVKSILIYFLVIKISIWWLPDQSGEWWINLVNPRIKSIWLQFKYFFLSGGYNKSIWLQIWQLFLERFKGKNGKFFFSCWRYHSGDCSFF